MEVGERLVLQLPAVKNWPRLERELQRMLEVRPKAEAGEVILDVGTQVLSADQLVQIEGMLREHGLNLMRVVHGPEGQDASEVPFSAKEEREEGHREGKRRLRSGKAGLPAPRVEAETDSQVEEPGEPTLVRRGP
ncbi:MAG TPA: hypothetical protein GX513_03020, partial [Firmicutes bacterium]|nr:hypothetical protein [Bacillota bacterium]